MSCRQRQRFRAPTSNRGRAEAMSRCCRPAKSVRTTRKPSARGNAIRTDAGVHRPVVLGTDTAEAFGFPPIDRGNPAGPAASEAAPVRCCRAERSSKEDWPSEAVQTGEIRHPGATGMNTGKLSGQSARLPQGVRMATGRCDQRRKGRARRTERCPAQDVVRPLKGKIPRMPSGWNKPDK